jgi:tellurite resistance protein
VASDSKGEVSGKWMHDHGAKYPYAHDRSKGLFTWVNAPGWPHAMLIDANGALAWSGGAESLSDDILQNAVKGAIAKPLWEWPASTKDAKTALLKHAYKAALDAAAKLSAADDGPAIKTAIEGIVNGKVEGMKAAYAKGDFLGAESAATAMQKEQDGLPGKAEAVKMLADLKANKDAAPVLVAQRKIAKFRGGDITKSKELEAAIDDLKKIAKDMANTYAATEATALAGDFQKRLKAKKGG